MISERIVLLAVLTASMYGLSMYMSDGAFIFPFGLYKVGLLLVAIILLIANRKKPRLMEVTLILWTLSLAISSKFIMQLLFTDNDFETRMDSLITFSSLFFLAFVLFFFAWQLLLAFQDKTMYRWLQIANAVAMMICLMMNMFEWLIVPTWMWVMTVFLSRSENPMHKSVAGLVGFIIVSSWCSALYFGKEAILGNL
ncbi:MULTISPECIES: hypothetical protein [Fluviicola]|uniref:hypothetical protein n=1 Tax=Fluviicola TaxID=332102 RepID=UPI0031382E87